MKHLTQKETRIFFEFLRVKLRLTKAAYARVIKISPLTIYWQVKNGKVKHEQINKFKEIFFKEINEI